MEGEELGERWRYEDKAGKEKKREAGSQGREGGLSLLVLLAPTHGLLLLNVHGFTGKDLSDFLSNLQSLFLKQHGEVCGVKVPDFRN